MFEEDHVIYPRQLIGEGYDPGNSQNTVPLAILMETDNHDGESCHTKQIGSKFFLICIAPLSQKQALLSLCTIDSFGEDSFSIKIIKQKLLVSSGKFLSYFDHVYSLLRLMGWSCFSRSCMG